MQRSCQSDGTATNANRRISTAIGRLGSVGLGQGLTVARLEVGLGLALALALALARDPIRIHPGLVCLVSSTRD